MKCFSVFISGFLTGFLEILLEESLQEFFPELFQWLLLGFLHWFFWIFLRFVLLFRQGLIPKFLQNPFIMWDFFQIFIACYRDSYIDFLRLLQKCFQGFLHGFFFRNFSRNSFIVVLHISIRDTFLRFYNRIVPTFIQWFFQELISGIIGYDEATPRIFKRSNLMNRISEYAEKLIDWLPVEGFLQRLHPGFLPRLLPGSIMLLEAMFNGFLQEFFLGFFKELLQGFLRGLLLRFLHWFYPTFHIFIY